MSSSSGIGSLEIMDFSNLKYSPDPSNSSERGGHSFKIKVGVLFCILV